MSVGLSSAENRSEYFIFFYDPKKTWKKLWPSDFNNFGYKMDILCQKWFLIISDSDPVIE